jgi:hypothetical protein
VAFGEGSLVVTFFVLVTVVSSVVVADHEFAMSIIANRTNSMDFFISASFRFNRKKIPVKNQPGVVM